MVLKPDKCSFILVGAGSELQTDVVCGNETLENSKQEKVLGVGVIDLLPNKLHAAVTEHYSLL